MTQDAPRTPGTRTSLLIVDLFRAGFSTDEITRLLALRARIPYTEYLSQADLDRLAFFKWRIAQRNTPPEP
ncbi:MAG: hypothetical protein DCC58_14370 [Chloroflexi bacterium]|nr:MAG: hypothetical protein DCC58_14370 [Chloroflexota bacterium]